jgi:hypothetical protein
MSPSPPPEFGTCLGDLYSVAWLENADDADLTVGECGATRPRFPVRCAIPTHYQLARLPRCCGLGCAAHRRIARCPRPLAPTPALHPHPLAPCPRAETLKKQFQLVKARVSRNYTYNQGSHVMRFGDYDIAEEAAALFQGQGHTGGWGDREGGGCRAWPQAACLAGVGAPGSLSRSSPSPAAAALQARARRRSLGLPTARRRPPGRPWAGCRSARPTLCRCTMRTARQRRGLPGLPPCAPWSRR